MSVTRIIFFGSKNIWNTSYKEQRNTDFMSWNLSSVTSYSFRNNYTKESAFVRIITLCVHFLTCKIMLWHDDWRKQPLLGNDSIKKFPRQRINCCRHFVCGSTRGYITGQMTDASSRQRRRSTSIKPQLSDSNKNVALGPRRGLTSRPNGRPTIGRNLTVTLTWSSLVEIRQLLEETV
jgi:hypothetical protein